ncbi:hypothetical protein Misp01_11160 [Microtetraspora sp. NBRC 13810]|uniref:ATP-binding protein n=1 Tax=Microtetraspora sp. NBRC 13810 TaxID=3030990 RepID=UPI0024A12BF3|nr:ATP-binding protein [Microtetraspora sp. NBRC 13810]GLW05986.1 hypothetical protein Misp01_11160 [Microtetraspora sp. NBRC 13810]
MRVIPFQATLLGEIHLPYSADSPGLARARFTSWVGETHPAAFTVQLVVSELVTNSVRHSDPGARPSIGARLFAYGEYFRLEVTDSGSAYSAPHIALPPGVFENSTDESGRGLALVDRVSAAWGVRTTRNPRGCLVWSHIAVTGE